MKTIIHAPHLIHEDLNHPSIIIIIALLLTICMQ